METKKKYLSLPRKIAYGSGDFGSNFFYTFVSSFIMIYLTDTVGLDAGIVGTLILISKILDGITDAFFGNLIDITHSKMGKARPWMFYSGFPLALCIFLMFAIPEDMSRVGQYAYFFIVYTCANTLFYTANNISYATMSALITKSDEERVTLGSFRYIFAVLAGILVSAITVILVDALGGGMEGWRNLAIIYAIINLVFNIIASLSCKELPEEEFATAAAADEKQVKQKTSFLESLKIVITNKYYLLILGVYLCMHISTNLGTSVGVYYFTYIFGDASLMGVVSLSGLVVIVGLIFNPMLVKKYGMYKVNLVSYIITTVITALSAVFAYATNLPGMVICSFLRCITMGPLMGSLNAIIAEVARNCWLRHQVHTEGMIFSCSSIGMKVGGGIGSSLCGWCLALVGYVGTAQVQTPQVLSMIKFLYGGVPMILTALLTVCLFFMKVEEDNNRLEKINH